MRRTHCHSQMKLGSGPRQTRTRQLASLHPKLLVRTNSQQHERCWLGSILLDLTRLTCDTIGKLDSTRILKTRSARTRENLTRARPWMKVSQNSQISGFFGCYFFWSVFLSDLSQHGRTTPKNTDAHKKTYCYRAKTPRNLWTLTKQTYANVTKKTFSPFQACLVEDTSKCSTGKEKNGIATRNNKTGVKKKCFSDQISTNKSLPFLFIFY